LTVSKLALPTEVIYGHLTIGDNVKRTGYSGVFEDSFQQEPVILVVLNLKNAFCGHVFDNRLSFMDSPLHFALSTTGTRPKRSANYHRSG
jgi:hypothetical protein